MREKIINTLVATLNNNMGNRLTPELIHGIVLNVNQELLNEEISKTVVESSKE